MKKKAFLSYARADEFYFKLLKQGLSVHGQNVADHWDVWEDTKIPVGKKWHRFIQQKVRECDFALLLISGNFLCSDYIREHELKEFLSRDYGGAFFVFPVLLAPCNFKRNEELASRQFFRCSGKAYGLPNVPDLTYADLVRITDNWEVLPNPNRERYHIDLVTKIEEAISQHS